MRELNLNGYIDEESWFGDEITPEMLHSMLYGDENQYADDVHIRLNSYGGSCNAATRMHDDIRAYPGNVSITISGTAASAATVIAMAADHLEITPGSLFMIHDPSTSAWGNTRDLKEAITLLEACKESILNIYGQRCNLERNIVSALMSATTWLDAHGAKDYGFVDAILDWDNASLPSNSAQLKPLNRRDAEKKVSLWLERQRHRPAARVEVPLDPPSEPVVEPVTPAADEPTPEPEQEAPVEEPTATGTPVDQLYTRLNLIRPIR